MASAATGAASHPTPDEVSAELTRITASDVFNNSPQLISFLTFVVEAALNGKSDRLKGYVIAVEVLRRDANFDPQIDPIVRVEATRLRRALARYYAGPGAGDDVLIEIPLGGYVPAFSRRAVGIDATLEAAADTAIATTAPVGWRSRWKNARPSQLVVAALVAGAAVLTLMVVRPGDISMRPDGLNRSPGIVAGPAHHEAAAPSPGNGMPRCW